MEDLYGAGGDQSDHPGRPRPGMARMDTLIIAACSFTAGIGLSGLVFYIRDLKKRITALEDANAKHLPFVTAEEIEHGIGALLPMLFEEDLRHERIENALAHFQRARGGKEK
jgi:hypothetical protein